MRIVIDGRMLGWTGIGRYTTHLLDQLERLDHDNEYIVLIQTADRDKWKPTAPNFRVELADIPPYSFAEQLKLPVVLRRLKPDLVHFTHFAVPLLYNARYVATVHDLILVEHKNYRGEGIKKLIYEIKYVASRLALRHAVKSARLVLTPTNYTKDQLASMFKLDGDRISATLLGVDKLSDKPIKPAMGGSFILSLGNSYPYKNLDRLVDAFAKTKFRVDGGKLVLAGPNDHFGTILRERVATLGLSDEVIFPGRVGDDELAGYLAAAELYVYPSLAEGFGLQALEAMQYDTPVLSSTASCLPEVSGDAAEYFDPTDTPQLTAKIDALIEDEGARRELVERGRDRIRHFTWKSMAEKTLAAYRVATKKAAD